MAAPQEPQDLEVTAVAALDEPTRRRLYDHVARQPGPVGRDEAAAAVDVPRSTAAFHLDRLADEGLLDVVYERRTGRSGPGAGRPSKLYRRSEREVSVSLPGRRYDLAGQLLAAALEEAEGTGSPPRDVLERHAREAGQEIGADAAAAAADAAEGAAGRENLERALLTALESRGYEPRLDGTDVVLANCPFHALAERHTDLVCGMNLHLLDGVLEALLDAVPADADRPPLRSRLDPGAGRCCVVIAADAASG
ncbi:MAG TPA: helix-turn-helix domain-containing protein [Nocardioidaceae bacterium]|nr:helix-turn-helix domain-containing protein [Nocardioidaceae bacterium]